MKTLLKGYSSAILALPLSGVKKTLAGCVPRLAKAIVIAGMLLSFGLAAQTVTPEMMEQIKNLPRAQQEELAKQYGVDLDQILEGGGNTAQKIARPGDSLEQRVVDEREPDEYLMFQEKFAEFQEFQIKQEEDLERFGISLFDREVSTFAPTDDSSVPDSYRLGAGDNFVIQLFGKDNEQYNLQVSRDGKISFPKLGPITVAGLTFEDARDLIRSRVADQLIGVQATISMGRLRAINIFMAGEVAVPGAYSVSALTTITQALFQAGGISDIGSLRAVQVKRDGISVASFDVYQLLLQGDASGDVRLQSGDVVFVPPYKGLVSVEGAVNRPMVYEFKLGESVNDAVIMAAGFSEDAYRSAISVISKAVDKNLPTVVNIDLSKSASKKSLLRNGDFIRVPKSTDTLRNAVTIEGAVIRPGVYGWVDGQRISDLLVSVFGDLKTTADLGYALVVRQKNERLDIEVLQIDLAAAILNVESDDNIATKPRDKIIVFGLPQVSEISSLNIDIEINEDSDLEADLDQRKVLLKPVIDKLQLQSRSGEPVQTVSIDGAVKSPGVFPLTAGLTVQKLVAAAGGLKDDAYTTSAELRRLYLNNASEVLSRYEEINLESEIELVVSTRLGSRDHLNVRAMPEWNPDDSVILEGEVRFPGVYRIRKGESISDVITRAGGLTLAAFPAGAIFTRESVAAKEASRAKEFSQSVIRSFASSQLTREDSSLDIAEVQSIAKTLQEFDGVGRLLVNINNALGGDNLADIGLEDGDMLTIPSQISTVTVVGEIRRPGTHTFQAGLDLNDYLDLSAGITARADDKELYVVRVDGSVFRPTNSWLRFDGAGMSLNAGDTIVVPINAGYTDNLSLWREITQVIFNSTAGLASIVAATK
jgi:polysaccharide biosynthesis/export protein